MKILMFGWEFPPYNSGGLGVACEGLVKALTQKGLEIIFVLPKKLDYKPALCRFIFASEPAPKKSKKIKSLQTRVIDSPIYPYITSGVYFEAIEILKDRLGPGQKLIYGSDLVSEVARYAEEAKIIALNEDFDLIHAHDWLCYPAGIEAKRLTRKPLVVHIHATEFDRTGGQSVNQQVYEIEKRGFEEADLIIAVSQFTKDKVVEYYGIKPEKIRVVHNAVDCEGFSKTAEKVFALKKAGKKIVLFVGRLTIQKGPDYFLRAAKKVLERRPETLFVIAGSGDMEAQLIEEVAAFNIAENVLFAGFVRGKELAQLYQLADLYVLPSVSEPFGITPLEALVAGTPVLISKQAGVGEVITHCLRADFWDINEMANKILAVIDYPELKEALSEGGLKEVKNIVWEDTGEKCLEVYREALNLYRNRI